MKKDALKEIMAKKEERIASAKLSLPEEEIKVRLQGLPPTRQFLAAINKPRVISLIAEIKKSSPSRGVIRGEDFDPVAIARLYQDTGVQAISVLTEEDFFSGSLTYLQEVRNAVTCPLLRKDFIKEPYQVYESRLYGADAVLLIADLLTKDELTALLQLSHSLGMDALVEVHTQKELKKVLNMKVPLPTDTGPSEGRAKKKTDEVRFAIGINNRDLHTLEVEFKTTERFFPMIPKDNTVVVESGIKSYQDVLFLKILGVNAVLIGEALMEATDIRRKVEEIMGW